MGLWIITFKFFICGGITEFKNAFVTTMEFWGERLMRRSV